MDPTAARDTKDPGDATARNFRYQHAYGVILLVAAKRGERPYVAIWCEQHKDFLAQRRDEVCDAYQVKTSRPELGAWRLSCRFAFHGGTGGAWCFSGLDEIGT